MAMRIFFASPGTKIPATYTTQYTSLNTSGFGPGPGTPTTRPNSMLRIDISDERMNVGPTM